MRRKESGIIVILVLLAVLVTIACRDNSSSTGGLRPDPPSIMFSTLTPTPTSTPTPTPSPTIRIRQIETSTSEPSVLPTPIEVQTPETVVVPVITEEPTVVVSPTIEATEQPTRTIEPTPLPPTSTPQITEETTTQVVSDGFQAVQATLASEIALYEQTYGTDVAIAAIDLQTGEQIAVDGDEVHLTGCVMNFFSFLVLVDYFQKTAADPTPFDYDVRKGVTGSLPEYIAQFLRNSVGSVDEGTRLGQELIEKMGLENTVFNHAPGYLDPLSPDFRDNATTVLDTNRALTFLWRGELFSPELTSYALVKMREIDNWGLRYIIPGQLPASATVAHKIGYFLDSSTGWTQNNIGIITFQGDDGQEKAFAVSFLSQRSPGKFDAGYFGAHLTKLVWDYFDAKY